MAFKMQTRPNRPTPSRKTNFIAETPKVIYSQTAADFRPPADYIGPRKSLMQRPPDPSLNPKKLSFPILSVSKLDLQVAPPPSAKNSLPRIESTASGKPKAPNKLQECAQVRRILQNMPQQFRKQFRSELRNKRPIIGRVKKFVHRDFHNLAPPEPINLHGILILGSSKNVMVEELPQDPGTPPPLSGRRHCVAQTDTYLEDIADNETGFVSTEMQCEPIYDEPLEATPLTFEDKNYRTTGTQLHDWVFPDIDYMFDQVATNLTEAVIMESLKQLQEEFELEALRRQHEYHKCLRNREIAILEKYKAAQVKYEAQKKSLDRRQPWDRTLDQIIQLVGFDKIRDIAPLHFIGSQTDQAIYEHILETMVPPINTEVKEKVEIKKSGRKILDSIIGDSVLKREAEYAGKMYTRDPEKKGSLATESPSRRSLDEEWTEEYENEEYSANEAEILKDSEIPEYPMTEHEVTIPQEYLKENEQPTQEGEAWDDIGEEKRQSIDSFDDYDDEYDE